MTYNYSLFWSKITWLMFFLMMTSSMFSIMNNSHTIIEWTINITNSCQMTLPLIFDPMNSLFSSVVLFISANVLMFSISYMSSDKFMKRFILLVMSFILSMNMLIFIPHMITLLLGWDGLGVTSFLLVIYYQNPKSLAAGMITALTNRIGDILILISIAWTLNQGHWMILQMWDTPMTPYIIMFIMVAALTKSAQIPFSSWLPAAMAAPTPVSALVHSSTLVTAGVFLLIRFYQFLSTLPLFNCSLLLLATSTMIMAGMSAMTETDLKKIIALSTLSQLGVMMAALGMGQPNIAFFHLITHALFKALLFICAGSIIQYNNHSQDIRTMGQFFNYMPITSSCLITANLALIGTPFLAGFYSKDLILEISMHKFMNPIIMIMFMAATILTASYSMRMVIMVLWGTKPYYPIMNNNNESEFLSSPAMVLSVGAIMMGVMMNWFYIAPFSHPILPATSMNTPLFMAVLGLLFGMYYTLINYSLLMKSKFTNMFLTSMWFMAPLSSQNIMKHPFYLSKLIVKISDMGWNEMLGGKGMHLMLSSMSSKMQMSYSTTISTQFIMSMMIMMPITIILFL